MKREPEEREKKLSQRKNVYDFDTGSGPLSENPQRITLQAKQTIERNSPSAIRMWMKTNTETKAKYWLVCLHHDGFSYDLVLITHFIILTHIINKNFTSRNDVANVGGEPQNTN